MSDRHLPAVLAFGLAFAALPVLSASALELKLAHQFSPDSLPGQSATHFADLVDEKSGGEVTVTVLPGGALGDERANLQQLGNGSIDLALTGDLVISYMARPYMIVSMPFIYDGPDHSLAVFNGEIGAEIKDYLAVNHGIEALGWQYVGTRVVTANRPVETLAGFRGLRMRLPGAEMWVKTWEKLDVDIASIAFTELYLALQTGTVSAQENPPNFIRAQKFYEVQDYIVRTNHVPQMQVFFMNAESHAALDEASRRAVDEAAAETVAWTSEQARATQESDLAWLTSEGGMTSVDVDLSGVRELIADVPAELLGEDGVQLYDRIVAAKR